MLNDGGDFVLKLSFLLFSRQQSVNGVECILENAAPLKLIVVVRHK